MKELCSISSSVLREGHPQNIATLTNANISITHREQGAHGQSPLMLAVL